MGNPSGLSATGSEYVKRILRDEGLECFLRFVTEADEKVVVSIPAAILATNTSRWCEFGHMINSLSRRDMLVEVNCDWEKGFWVVKTPLQSVVRDADYSGFLYADDRVFVINSVLDQGPGAYCAYPIKNGILGGCTVIVGNNLKDAVAKYETLRHCGIIKE